MKKKICLIAQFPPPIHGLSKAVDTLIHSPLSKEFDLEIVNITNNRRFLSNLIKIFKSNADLFYLTISQTKGGNLRDLMILTLLNFQKKRTLIHLHGGYYRTLVDTELSSLQSKWNYKTLSKVDGAIVLSESLKSNFANMIEDGKSFVISNCIDNEFLLTDEEFSVKLANLSKKKVINVLYLSNFIKTKGYVKVLELARLEKKRVNSGEEKRFHFDFAGNFFDDKERNYFFSYIQKNALQEFVTYHGVVGGKEKKELLRTSDIFILLSRYPNEGQPISILEAMGNGCLIVTTDHAGIVHIVKDKINGIVVNSKQQKNLETLYEKLCWNKEVSIRNRATILKNYTESIYINKIREIFSKL